MVITHADVLQTPSELRSFAMTCAQSHIKAAKAEPNLKKQLALLRRAHFAIGVALEADRLSTEYKAA